MNTLKTVKRNSGRALAGVLFAIVGIALACVAVKAFAAGSALATADQRIELTPYTVTNLLKQPVLLTNGTASARSIGSNTVVDVRRHRYIGVVITGSLITTNATASAPTVSIPVYRSLDGTVLETTPTTTLVWIPSSTSGAQGTTVTLATNIDTGEFGYVNFGPWSVGIATGVVAQLNVQIGGKQPWALTWPGQSTAN